MKTYYKESRGDRLFRASMNIFLVISLIIVLYPLIYIVSASFSKPSEVISGKVWLFPVKPTLLGYQTVFKNTKLMSGFFNSFIYATFGTVFNVVMTILAAYPLSRKQLVGRKFFLGMFIFTMFFSGGLIPIFLTVKGLGLYNTRLAMIIPTALSVWNMIIARTFFMSTIPEEMYEASNIDGCNDFAFLVKLVLPLSKPIIAVIALYYCVGHWNSYFNALIYLKDVKYFPLQLVLRDILVMSEVDPTMIADVDILLRKQGLKDIVKFAIIVVASVPVLCVYPFVQKYFVKGVMVGALKD